MNSENTLLENSHQSTFRAIIIMCVLYFSFGFVTWLNGTLIPFLKMACELKNDTQSFFVTFAFYIAYFVLALPASSILKKTGYKKGIVIGLLIIAAGSLVFIPAAHQRSFALFLTGLFIQGGGLALLQTAANPYITIIGPRNSAAKRISIMGICNKTAGIISPLILSATLLKGANLLDKKIATTTDINLKEQLLAALSARIIVPYLIIALLLIATAFLIYLSSLPDIDTDSEDPIHKDQNMGRTIFQFPHLWLGVVCIFLYVGAEVMAGDAIGTYGKALGLPLSETRYFTSFTLFAMLLGYMVGIFTIPKLLSQQMSLTISAILGIIFSIGVFITSGYTAIFFIALLGLANALMWPAIFPLAIDRLGKFTKTGSALLVMGIAGGAVLPILYGWLKDSLHLANNLSFFICLAPCYLYILFYAIKGYKFR